MSIQMLWSDSAPRDCRGCSDTECALRLAKTSVAYDNLDHLDWCAPSWPQRWGHWINEQASWRHIECLIKRDVIAPISSESVDEINWWAVSPNITGKDRDAEVWARDRCWLLLAEKPGVILPGQALELFSCWDQKHRRIELLIPVLSRWKPLLASPLELTKALGVALGMGWKGQELLGGCLSRELADWEAVISVVVPNCPLVLVTVILRFLIPPGWEPLLVSRQLSGGKASLRDLSRLQWQ